MSALERTADFILDVAGENTHYQELEEIDESNRETPVKNMVRKIQCKADRVIGGDGTKKVSKTRM